MYFKETGENKYTYQHYFPFWVLFIPPKTLVAIWHHFPSAWGTPLSISCSASLLATKSHFHMPCYSLFPSVDSSISSCYGHSPVPSESHSSFVFCPEFIIFFCRKISSIQATSLLSEAAHILRCQKIFKHWKDILGHVTIGKRWITQLQNDNIHGYHYYSINWFIRSIRL